MSSREAILGKLRERGEVPFPAAAPPQGHRHVVPLADMSMAGLYGRFLQEASKAACIVHEAASNEIGRAHV